MDSILAFLSHVWAATHEAQYWQTVPLSVPATAEAYTLIGAGLVLLLLLYTFIVWPRGGTDLKLKFRDDWPNDPDPEQWNIVQMRLSTAREKFKEKFEKSNSGDRYTIILVAKNDKGRFKSVTCRLHLNQAFDQAQSTTIEMSRKLGRKLGFANVNQEEFESRIKLRWPAWRVDKYTFASPDPDVRLQWNLGTVFLVLGVLIPKLIDFMFPNWGH